MENRILKNLSYFKLIEKLLARRKSVSASFEAESMIKHFGNMSRIDLFTGNKSLSLSAKSRIKKAVGARLRGEPLGYLFKETEFFGYKFYLNADTLIPRPETEGLVEETLKLLKKEGLKSPKIMDLGTGSGCIAISLTRQRPDCKMTALDVSVKALKIARKNLILHDLEKSVELLKSDLFSLFGKQRKNFWDVIVSNPPYVPSEDFGTLSEEVLKEPPLALDGGPEGLQVIVKILRQAPYYLKAKGWLLMEIGYGQAPMLESLLKKEGLFEKIRFVKDYAGIDRILVAQKSDTWTN